MIRFLKFQKLYNARPALSIGHFTIEAGIYWVKGINGSGKSTLLKSMAGILPFEGDILLNDSISIKKEPVAYRKLVNFAEAEPLFPEFLTGKEMIDLFTAAKGARVGQAKYYTDQMEMESYLAEPVGSYSSGMVKKLSLVLAFIGNPRLILLDEPLITLDSKSLNVLYKWIAEKFIKDGTSFLLSSHQHLEFEALPKAKTLLVEDQTVTFI